LKGKHVVLVGPAQSILGTNQGNIIDNFDVVVRIKKALSLPSELEPDIGKRCDVLYHSMNFNSVCGGKLDLDLLKRKKVKFLMGVYPPVNPQLENLGYKEHFQDILSIYTGNLAHVDIDWFLNIVKSVGALPNTGTMAILDILNHDVASLYITGITFFRGGYIPCYHSRYTEKGITNFIKEVGLHKTELELDYILKKFSQDKRVTWHDKELVIDKKENDNDYNRKRFKIQNTLKYREKLKQIRQIQKLR